MMTLKWLKDFRHEVVKEVKQVEFMPTMPGVPRPRLWYMQADNHEGFYDYGTAFLMNEDGKTVSIYRMESPSDERTISPSK